MAMRSLLVLLKDGDTQLVDICVRYKCLTILKECLISGTSELRLVAL